MVLPDGNVVAILDDGWVADNLLHAAFDVSATRPSIRGWSGRGRRFGPDSRSWDGGECNRSPWETETLGELPVLRMRVKLLSAAKAVAAVSVRATAVEARTLMVMGIP